MEMGAFTNTQDLRMNAQTILIIRIPTQIQKDDRYLNEKTFTIKELVLLLVFLLRVVVFNFICILAVVKLTLWNCVFYRKFYIELHTLVLAKDFSGRQCDVVKLNQYLSRSPQRSYSYDFSIFV